MRLAVVHYHLRPGGVTAVIERMVRGLRERGLEVTIFSGEPAPSGWEGVRVVPGLGYTDKLTRQGGDELSRALLDAAGPVDIWHFHNYSLGKNPALPIAVSKMARMGVPMVLQIHDFAENGRPANYRLLLKETGGGSRSALERILYPGGGHVQYAVLTRRDAEILERAGAAAAVLPNPILPLEDDSIVEPSQFGWDEMLVVPARGIVRKNMGEALLWSVLLDMPIVISQRPADAAAGSALAVWEQLAARLGRKAIFGGLEMTGERLPALVRGAKWALTTSLMEGFGMAFLEPWIWGRAVCGRDLRGVTQDFRRDGVRLEGLYQRLDIPRDWVSRDLRELARQRVGEQAAAYQISVTEEAVRRELDRLARGDGVDFGYLSATCQAEVISRLSDSREERGQVMPPVLMPAGIDVINHNAEVIREKYSLDACVDRVLALYRSLGSRDAEDKGPDAGVVLREFLAI